MKTLNKPFWLKKEIKQLEDKIRELTIISTSTLSGVPGGSAPSSSVEKYYEKYEHLKNKLEKKKIELIAELERVESVIENIADSEIRIIARMRYMDNKGYEEIARDLYMDRTTPSKKLKRYFERIGAEDNE